MNVTYWFRNQLPGGYSIEQIFETISTRISPHHKVIRQTLPFTSSSIYNMLRNLFFVISRPAPGIQHITGDVHYVALALGKKKTVLTIHDCVILNNTARSSLKHHVFLWLWYKLPIWKSNIVTTISEKSKRDIIAYTGCAPDKIRVIPNFVSPAFQPVPQNFNTARPRILHIGITPNKNLERLIEALSGLSCVLEIIGNLHDSLRQMLDQHHISFENYENISAETMVERYQAADLVVFVSTYEGFGMPIIEAQATGRPVVTSNLEPMTAVAGPNGACLVNPFDVADIRAGILRLQQDEIYRNTLIQNGLENVRRFTLNAVAQQYLELYQSLSPTHVRHHQSTQSGIEI